MPPMFPPYGHGGFVPYSNSFGTASSKLYSDQEYDEYESDQSNPAFSSSRKGPGPILGQMLEEFHKGDEMLQAEDRKKKGSWWSLTKSSMK